MTDEPMVVAQNGGRVPLREYVEMLFAEKQRQLDLAADEREKAAAALRDEQYRGVQTAEREREKAAEALRTSVETARATGEARLRESACLERGAELQHQRFPRPGGGRRDSGARPCGRRCDPCISGKGDQRRHRRREYPDRCPQQGFQLNPRST